MVGVEASVVPNLVFHSWALNGCLDGILSFPESSFSVFSSAEVVADLVFHSWGMIGCLEGILSFPEPPFSVVSSAGVAANVVALLMEENVTEADGVGRRSPKSLNQFISLPIVSKN